jgi:flagellar protein FliO/FliZ
MRLAAKSIMRKLAFFSLTLLSLAASAPALAADSVAGSGLWSSTFGMLVLIGVLAAAAWILRRVGQPRAMRSGPLRVVGATHVGPRERVVVVEAGDTWLVVGVAPGRVNALHVLPRAGDTPTVAAPAVPSFAEWLKRFGGDHGKR